MSVICYECVMGTSMPVRLARCQSTTTCCIQFPQLKVFPFLLSIMKSTRYSQLFVVSIAVGGMPLVLGTQRQNTPKHLPRASGAGVVCMRGRCKRGGDHRDQERELIRKLVLWIQVRLGWNTNGRHRSGSCWRTLLACPPGREGDAGFS